MTPVKTLPVPRSPEKRAIYANNWRNLHSARQVRSNLGEADNAPDTTDKQSRSLFTSKPLEQHPIILYKPFLARVQTVRNFSLLPNRGKYGRSDPK
jgi:hypothetical protein